MMRKRGTGRAIGRLAIAAAVLIGSTGTAFAQLDPLLFMKTSKPNVVLVVDMANRMQRDANDDYYDQFVYQRTYETWEWTLGVSDLPGVCTAALRARRFCSSCPRWPM